MDPIRELLQRLAELTLEEVQEGITLIRARAGELADGDPSETADELTELADALDQFRERETALETEEEQRAERARTALARINGEEDGEDGDGDDGDGEDGEDGQDGEDGDNEGAEGEQHREPVVASGRGGGGTGTSVPRPGEVSRRQQRAGSRRRQEGPQPLRARSVVVAAADLGSGIASGQAFDSIDPLVEAFDRRRRAVSGTKGGNGENVPVLSIQTTYPEERILTDDAALNRERIRAASSTRAIVAAGDMMRTRGAVVAAGGLCAPVETLYDIEVLGSTARPVRDALLGFQTSRGGIQFRRPPVFQDSEPEGGFRVWTLADDEAQNDPDVADPDPKPCLPVWCPDMDTAYIEAIPLCLTFSNITARFDPEATAANIRATQIAHARFLENRLMTRIANGSKTLTQAAAVSAARDLLVMCDKTIAYFRNRHRLEDAVPLRMVLPRWARDMIRADLTRGMVGDLEALAVADADIVAWFARRNVNITWHIDGRGATVAGAGEVAMPDQFYADAADNGVLPGFPDAVESLIWQEGDWTYLNGGNLDLGVVRDSTLNAQNQYKTFAEQFEGLASRGVEPLRVVAGTQPTGASVGTVAPALAD